MNTIKRFYLYAVAFISAEVVLWGLIGLSRSLVAGTDVPGGVARLASALSLILVGMPVFLIHWGIAQRGASVEIEERSSRLRAIFLYGILLSTLLPLVQNTLALVNRQVATAVGIEVWQVLVGSDQVLSDNLIAIAVNAATALYFFSVLRKDWQSSLGGDAFAEVRRIYRYIWLIYGLGLTIYGSQSILQFLFRLPALPGTGQTPNGIHLNDILRGAHEFSLLANGIALLLIGAPLLIFTNFWIQRSLGEPSERSSMLRLVVLYSLAFISVGVVLVSSRMLLDRILQWFLGERMSVTEFMQFISQPVSVAFPFVLVWVYYGSALSREVNTISDTPRWSGLRRLYYYILAIFGLAAAFIGLQLTIIFLVEYLMEVITWDTAVRTRLAASLSTILVGLPLWMITWRPMVYESRTTGEAGDHARRSLVRKAYLFLFIFVGVMGVMFSAGMLLFLSLRTILGDPPERLTIEVLQLGASFTLFLLLLTYHWRTLRGDIRLAEKTLTKQHAQFPVLILAPEDDELILNLVEALKRQAAAMPVSIHRFSQGVPDETLSAAKAVVIPGELVAKPPEGLRLWLQSFSGAHLVLPTPAKSWHWVFGSGQPIPAIANQTARMLRQLAEGETITTAHTTSSWMIVVYVLAFLFTLQIALALSAILANLFF